MHLKKFLRHLNIISINWNCNCHIFFHWKVTWTFYNSYIQSLKHVCLSCASDFCHISQIQSFQHVRLLGVRLFHNSQTELCVRHDVCVLGGCTNKTMLYITGIWLQRSRGNVGCFKTVGCSYVLCEQFCKVNMLSCVWIYWHGLHFCTFFANHVMELFWFHQGTSLSFDLWYCWYQSPGCCWAKFHWILCIG